MDYSKDLSPEVKEKMKKNLVFLLVILSGCATLPIEKQDPLVSYHKCNKSERVYLLQQSFILEPIENEINNGLMIDGFDTNDCVTLTKSEYLSLSGKVK